MLTHERQLFMQQLYNSKVDKIVIQNIIIIIIQQH